LATGLSHIAEKLEIHYTQMMRYCVISAVIRR